MTTRGPRFGTCMRLASSIPPEFRSHQNFEAMSRSAKWPALSPYQDSQPNATNSGYIVNLKPLDRSLEDLPILPTYRTIQIQTPPIPLEIQSSCSLDSIANLTELPIARLPCLDRSTKNSSQNVLSMSKDDHMSWDEPPDFWGWKTDDGPPQNPSRCSRDTDIKRPPPQTCRDWLRGRCTFGDGCKWVHGDLSDNLLDAPPDPSPQICRDWLRGGCTFGNRCKWVHENLNDDLQSESHFLITVHNHIIVKIGPGFEILDLRLDAETPWIVLSNIPAHVDSEAKEIEQLLSSFGSVLDVQVEPPATPSWAKNSMIVNAKFTSHGEAVRACESLDGSTFLNARISAQIPTADSQRRKTFIQNCSAEIQWEAPHKVGYGGYPSIDRAHEAIATAAKGPSDDYHVHAAVHVGLPSIGTVTVRFTNLPPTATADFMQRFSAPEDLMWERPNYLSLASAIDGIKRSLRKLQNFVELEVHPPPYSHGLIRACATFASPVAARAGARVLHGQKPGFTGKTQIRARHVWTLKYRVSGNDYRHNAPLIDNLRESVFQNEGLVAVSMRQLRSSMSMLIRLSAEEPKSLGQLKVELDKILQGEIIRRDGVAVWDSFFARPKALDYLRGVEAEEPCVRIEADKVKRTLKLFGTSSGRAAAQIVLVQKVTDLKAQQERIFCVPGRVVGAFVATQLSRLCEKFGDECIFVDIKERTVTLRGGDELYEAYQEAIHQAQKRPTPVAEQSPTQHIAECVVCFNEAVSPITLRCGHRWCCWHLCQYILAAVDNRQFPLMCPGNEARCTDSQSISLSIVRTVLEPSEFSSIVEAAISAYVRKHSEEFQYCPASGCTQVYRKEPKNAVVQCRSCLLRICSHCHSEVHDGFTCTRSGSDRTSWAKDLD
ncbi:hypothetical protein K438DRAFT_1735553 [Mycena galopus ATCC 62051]|nr:hypothetical protein K438DRAFT_1735553 [Mycena galopus ATCC 62051]